MTQEQFTRAVEIAKRLKDLEEVKKEINDKEKHRLSYSYYSSEWRLCPSWIMSQIGESILDKHDRLIRMEINDEIQRLKEEIEKL